MQKIFNEETTKIIDKANELGLLKTMTSKKTVADLFEYAFRFLGMEKEEVREHLKGTGKFDPEKWLEYTQVLTSKWKYLDEAKEKNPCWDKSRKERLREQAKEAVWQHGNCDENGLMPFGYVLVGTPEAIAAYWELQDLLREENVKKWKEKYYGIYIRELREVEAMEKSHDPVQQGLVCVGKQSSK